MLCVPLILDLTTGMVTYRFHIKSCNRRNKYLCESDSGLNSGVYSSAQRLKHLAYLGNQGALTKVLLHRLVLQFTAHSAVIEVSTSNLPEQHLKKVFHFDPKNTINLLMQS